VEIFWKPYLSHLDSELDVLYMGLDLLDETYPVGKSKLPFKDFGQGGLTGVQGGLTGLAQTCHFWVSTQTLPRARNIHYSLWHVVSMECQ
jgi:hypothetical protein